MILQVQIRGDIFELILDHVNHCIENDIHGYLFVCVSNKKTIYLN